MQALITKDILLFFTLMNPFLMSIYLLDLILNMESRAFGKVLMRGTLIAIVTFVIIAWVGESLFRDILQVRFESFQLFGGVVFLILGLRYVFQGAQALSSVRGDPEHLAGSIAMPFMIGPGTVSAAVIVGSHHRIDIAAGILGSVMAVTLATLYGLKLLHDYVKQRNARLIDRYVEIVGRIAALLSGTIAVEMILTGLDRYLQR